MYLPHFKLYHWHGIYLVTSLVGQLAWSFSLNYLHHFVQRLYQEHCQFNRITSYISVICYIRLLVLWGMKQSNTYVVINIFLSIIPTWFSFFRKVELPFCISLCFYCILAVYIYKFTIWYAVNMNCNLIMRKDNAMEMILCSMIPKTSIVRTVIDILTVGMLIKYFYFMIEVKYCFCWSVPMYAKLIEIPYIPKQ